MPELRLTVAEREWLESDEAKAIAEAARARQDVRDDDRLCAEVDALIAERNGGAFADVELPWITAADPEHAAEVAAVQATWDEIDANLGDNWPRFLAEGRTDDQGQVAT